MAASPDHPNLVLLLLRLYPRAWRARYADEFGALLADAALTPLVIVDIVLSALDARWSGDYPSAPSDDRKVRHPVVDRLAALLTAVGGAYLAALVFVDEVAPPLDDRAFIAVAALAGGIAGLSLGWLGRDPVGRALGLVASALAIGLMLETINFNSGVWEQGSWDAFVLMLQGFAAVSGLVGLRVVLMKRNLIAGLVLVAMGAIASVLWLIARPPGGSVDVTAHNFVLAMVAWSVVGLLGLRSRAPITAMA